MHPAPVDRDVEIARPAWLKRQNHALSTNDNGVFVRMAILESRIGSKAPAKKHKDS